MSVSSSNFACLSEEPLEEEIEPKWARLIKMTEKFPSLVKNINLQIQEDRINPQKLMPKYIIIKLMKIEDKKRIFKAARKNDTLLTRKQFQMTAKFLSGIMKGRIKWDNLRCWGNKNNNPVNLEVLNPAKIPS